MLIATVASTMLGGAVRAETLSPQVAQQIHALWAAKAARSPVQQKIGSHLIYAAKLSRGESVGGIETMPLRVHRDGAGRVLVDISGTVSPTLSTAIAALGGEVVHSYARYRAMRAWLPLSAMEELAALPEVSAIHPAAQSIHRKLTTSEGDIAHRANLVRSMLGINGSGVKVGVLSDSVDNLSIVQKTGDVGSVTVLPGQSGVPATGEGTALLEILYDLAPGATAYFATTGDSDAAMATNIQALRAAGCDILMDDVAFFDEPVFQDGVIAQAVESVTADGALYLSAAGNGGNADDGTSGTWEGDFVASSSTVELGGGTTEALHDFGGGITLDAITAVSGQTPAIVTLQWSDAFGASANDYDLFVVSGDTVVAASTDSQSGTGDPIEAVDISGLPTQGLSIAIGQFSGAARFLHLDTNGDTLAIHTAGEINGHPAAVGAVAVAAVDAQGASAPFSGGAANPVETYSSDGPRRIFYEVDGTPITPGNFSSTGGTVRQKPDVAAADCVSVSTPGFDPFCGTSAAAGHAAAIAALVKSANPSLTNTQVRDALTSTALDIEAPGFDRDSGFGVLDAFAAAQSIAVPSLCAATPKEGCRSAAMSRLLVTQNAEATKDKLSWLWRNGAATSQAEFGTPTTTADYALCIYADSVPALIAQANVPASASKWRTLGVKGYRYRDPTGVAGGITMALLGGSDQDKSKVLVKAKGPGVSAVPLPVTAPVTVQIVNGSDGLCWGITYNALDVNGPAQLEARVP